MKKLREEMLAVSVLIPILVAVVPTIGTAIFGLWSYGQQRRVDREVDLRNQRRKDYERYITAYQKDTSLYDYDPRPTETSEAKISARSEYWIAYSNLFQIASDPVVRATSNFHNFWWEYDPSNQEQFNEFSALYAKMIVAMRVDVSERTELSLEEMRERVPFAALSVQSTEGEGREKERENTNPP